MKVELTSAETIQVNHVHTIVVPEEQIKSIILFAGAVVAGIYLLRK